MRRTPTNPHGKVMGSMMAESSLPALLHDRASRQPDATAYTFIDYEADPSGFAESLTWAQVHRRALVVAEELRLCGSVGDRAAILAPQGLDYIVAFLGALQAGFITVPLSVPQFGVLEERVSSAFSAAPNFAFELVVGRTSDDDMAGLDLGNVIGIVSGSRRTHAATVKRKIRRSACAERYMRDGFERLEASA